MLTRAKIHLRQEVQDTLSKVRPRPENKTTTTTTKKPVHVKVKHWGLKCLLHITRSWYTLDRLKIYKCVNSKLSIVHEVTWLTQSTAARAKVTWAATTNWRASNKQSIHESHTYGFWKEALQHQNESAIPIMNTTKRPRITAMRYTKNIYTLFKSHMN